MIKIKMHTEKTLNDILRRLLKLKLAERRFK